MANQLFEKCVAFTDIHFGKTGNSEDYNKKALAFVDWFIKEGKAWGADTCIFLGDWHDSRISVHVKTMNYSLTAMERLGKAFNQFIFLTGNHDIYHKTRRDFISVEFARNIENLNIINEPIILGDVGLIPWLVGDEWKDIKKYKCKYMFGHFELPRFLMNARVEMPDHGGIATNDLAGPEYVFTGHFHKRQNQNNIWYIGNAFPQNYTDTGDDDRGMMFFEWDGEPRFKTWPDQPIYRVYNLSEILDGTEKYIHRNVHARINVDIDMTYEEAQYLRESFLEAYQAADIKFIQKHSDVEEIDWSNLTQFLSVDQIVVDGLNNIDDNSVYDKKLLVDMYNDLNVEE